MGLLQKFRVDTAGAWKADAGLALHFDFDANALSGVRLRDPLPLLWKFGTPENPDAPSLGSYRWFSRGFEASVQDNRIDGFVLFWNSELNAPYRPFAGTCSWRGKNIQLRAGLTEPELLAIFGEPFSRNADADEIILFYKNNAIEWQMEISSRTGLSAITITSPPMYA